MLTRISRLVLSMSLIVMCGVGCSNQEGNHEYMEQERKTVDEMLAEERDLMAGKFPEQTLPSGFPLSLYPGSKIQQKTSSSLSLRLNQANLTANEIIDYYEKELKSKDWKITDKTVTSLPNLEAKKDRVLLVVAISQNKAECWTVISFTWKELFSKRSNQDMSHTNGKPQKSSISLGSDCTTEDDPKIHTAIISDFQKMDGKRLNHPILANRIAVTAYLKKRPANLEKYQSDMLGNEDIDLILELPGDHDGSFRFKLLNGSENILPSMMSFPNSNDYAIFRCTEPLKEDARLEIEFDQ
ncbi:MAG: hypothetical protein K2Z81_19560 [Cyanobacteria bacterium]|nr:hypothetical protein [Cyanobacteriota bacterium]